MRRRTAIAAAGVAVAALVAALLAGCATPAGWHPPVRIAALHLPAAPLDVDDAGSLATANALFGDDEVAFLGHAEGVPIVLSVRSTGEVCLIETSAAFGATCAPNDAFSHEGIALTLVAGTTVLVLPDGRFPSEPMTSLGPNAWFSDAGSTFRLAVLNGYGFGASTAYPGLIPIGRVAPGATISLLQPRADELCLRRDEPAVDASARACTDPATFNVRGLSLELGATGTVWLMPDGMAGPPGSRVTDIPNIWLDAAGAHYAAFERDPSPADPRPVGVTAAEGSTIRAAARVDALQVWAVREPSPPRVCVAVTAEEATLGRACTSEEAFTTTGVTLSLPRSGRAFALVPDDADGPTGWIYLGGGVWSIRCSDLPSTCRTGGS